MKRGVLLNREIANLLVIILLVASVCPTCILAQQVNFRFHHLTEKDGVVPSERYYFFKDSRNYTWIGTDEGLLQFDGHALHQHTSRSHASNKLDKAKVTSQCIEDDLGNLWFSSTDALYCYVFEKDEYLAFREPNTQGNYQLILQDKEGDFWLRIGDRRKGKLLTFSPQSGKFSVSIELLGSGCTPVFDSTKTITALVQTELSNSYGILITDLKSGDSQQAEYNYTEEGVARTLSSPARGCIVDAERGIWTGSYNGIGYNSPTSKYSWVAIKRDSLILDDIGFVRDLTAYSDQYILAAADQGLFVFDRTSKKFINQFLPSADRPFSLPFKSVSTIYLDDKGCVWVAGKNGELAFSTGDKQKFKDLKGVGTTEISTLQCDVNGRVWCSTVERGTYLLSSKHDNLHHAQNILLPAYPDETVSLPQIDFFLDGRQKSWWGVMDNQFARWVPEQSRFEFREQNFLGVYGAAETSINFTLSRKKHSPLIAFGRKLYQLGLKGEYIDTLPYYNTNHLDLAPITFLGETRQSLLAIGDQQGRLVVLKEEGNLLTVIADLPGLGTIHALHQDTTRNTLWLTTSKGLAQLNPETFELSWRTKEDDNLPQETYYNAIPDEPACAYPKPAKFGSGARTASMYSTPKTSPSPISNPTSPSPNYWSTTIPFSPSARKTRATSTKKKA